MAENASEFDLEAQHLMSQRRLLLPPFDTNATQLEDAYDLKAILTPMDVKALGTYVAGLHKHMQGDADDLQTRHKKTPFSSFVLRHLRSLRQMDAKSQKRLMPRVAYIQALLKLCAMPRRIKDVEKVAKPPLLPLGLLERALQKFREADENGSWSQTKFLKDKLLLCVCVLALGLENYSLDPKLLAGDVGTSVQKLKDLLKELGCVPKIVKENGEKSKRLMVLQVPLKFPARRKAKARR